MEENIPAQRPEALDLAPAQRPKALSYCDTDGSKECDSMAWSFWDKKGCSLVSNVAPLLRAVYG